MVWPSWYGPPASGKTTMAKVPSQATSLHLQLLVLGHVPVTYVDRALAAVLLLLRIPAYSATGLVLHTCVAEQDASRLLPSVWEPYFCLFSNIRTYSVKQTLAIHGIETWPAGLQSSMAETRGRQVLLSERRSSWLASEPIDQESPGC